MEQKKSIDPDREQLTKRGFLIPADAKLNLDFLAGNETELPITLQIELIREEHLELVRAILKKNYMCHNEKYDKVESSITLKVDDYPFSFRYCF
jgi:hypothetical protein